MKADNNAERTTKYKRYRAHGCKQKDCTFIKIVLAGKIYFQNCPPALSLGR